MALVGYMTFAVVMLHVTRSATDVAVLAKLQQYTYVHLLLQGTFLGFGVSAGRRV